MSAGDDASNMTVMKLEGGLHISGVAALKQRMLDAVRSHPLLVLDMEGVTDCDTASLQLIVAACRPGLPGGETIRLSRYSPAVATAAEKLGLQLPPTTDPSRE